MIAILMLIRSVTNLYMIKNLEKAVKVAVAKKLEPQKKKRKRRKRSQSK